MATSKVVLDVSCCRDRTVAVGLRRGIFTDHPYSLGLLSVTPIKMQALHTMRTLYCYHAIKNFSKGSTFCISCCVIATNISEALTARGIIHLIRARVNGIYAPQELELNQQVVAIVIHV